jgi:hypothetical protein
MARGSYNRRHTKGVLRKKFAMRQLKARTQRKATAARRTSPSGLFGRRRSGPTRVRTSGTMRTSTTQTRGSTSSASIRSSRRKR